MNSIQNNPKSYNKSFKIHQNIRVKKTRLILSSRIQTSCVINKTLKNTQEKIVLKRLNRFFQLNCVKYSCNTEKILFVMAAYVTNFANKFQCYNSLSDSRVTKNAKSTSFALVFCALVRRLLNCEDILRKRQWEKLT